MKYVVILGDGMADYPLEQLRGKTPLQCASKPNIDRLAQLGETGIVKTIPDDLPPGSDVANLSAMGYDPRKYYTGRSPLEAVSMGIQLSNSDIALRCNLVTLSGEPCYKDKIMEDYSSDEITSEEAAVLVDEINKHFENERIKFYAGVSYRHCMVWKPEDAELLLTPPHDILEKKIGPYLPSGRGSNALLEMMEKSFNILKDHPVNKTRIAKGLRPANSIWLWGEGRKPALPSFVQKYGLTGSVISAVDLIKGIGILAGLNSVDVKGATGNINTNFKGKAEAALNELKNGKDFVYIHIEAPDECGHRYEIDNKVRSIELIDNEVVKTILGGLEQFDDYSIMILPDHPTPLSLRTHAKDPVPYIIYRKNGIKNPDAKACNVKGYDEEQAKLSGIFIEDGFKLMDRFLNK